MSHEDQVFFHELELWARLEQAAALGDEKVAQFLLLYRPWVEARLPGLSQ
jgi:hypothetical protein